MTTTERLTASSDKPAAPTLRQRLSQLTDSGGATGAGYAQVVVGVVLLWTLFTILNPRFISPLNLTNLSLQIVTLSVMAIGVCLVLLLGEIDLSVGSVSGLAATVAAYLNVVLGVPAPIAFLAAAATGCGVGLLQGAIIVGFGVPSFVVTLGGLIGWQGVQLLFFSFTGAMIFTDPQVLGLTTTFFPPIAGWALAIGAMVVLTGLGVRSRAQRAKAGLSNPPAWTITVRLGVIAALLAIAILVFSADRGIPLGVLIVFGLIIVVDFLVRRTTTGRHIYAVGGDRVAAERVGINVAGISVLVFSACGFFAAIAGILSASRLQSVTQSAGSGDLLLNAIAAVVIGGTSLFGGRGSIWSALLGALVIGSISNGMDLLGLESPVKLMVTGVVLISAVVFDATMRRRAAR